SDLEELHRDLSADPVDAPTRTAPTKRKKEGAFSTPPYVTRYIVAETLGPVLLERFEALRTRHLAAVRGRIRSALEAPQEYAADDLTAVQRKALVLFWEDWILELETVRVVDPACGSGAFLIEAFDQLFLEYARAQGYLTELKGGPTLFDVQRTILTKNLFGMDLNGEAVEIARLSCWIKTAEKGKELTALDDNIQTGNSIVAEPDPLTAWRNRFPAAFADGGFDVVLGNPPYVRQEWIAADKPFLKQHYKAFDGVADLYVYFYELGLNVLKPGGRLGFIVTNKWMKAGYGEALRTLFGEAAWVESVIDLGHNKEIFPDADVFPCILVARKPSNDCPP
ncbi:MAG: Eco57I restriction-modification methylase domain-containing protein, partial [Fimbriiglobus sp.]